MAAYIRCVLHLDPDQLDDDEFAKAWGQVKMYLEVVHQVKFE